VKILTREAARYSQTNFSGAFFKARSLWVSFPGTERSEGAGEPSNHCHSCYLELWILDSGFAAARRPGMTRSEVLWNHSAVHRAQRQ